MTGYSDEDVETAAQALAATRAASRHGQLCSIWRQRNRGPSIDECDCWILPNARAVIPAVLDAVAPRIAERAEQRLIDALNKEMPT